MVGRQAALAALAALVGGFTLGAQPTARLPLPTPRPVLAIPIETPTPQPSNPVSRLAPGPSPHSEVVRHSFFSQVMGQPRIFNVYLPPSYNLPQAQHRSYPVFYLLHGDDASIDAWPSMGIRELADRAIEDRGLPELIVVMPDGSGHYNDETDWANRWDGSDPLEDHILEVVRQVDDSYRTLSVRAFRFIGGYSSGGFGALNIALRHPDLFSVVLGLSGFARADDWAADQGVFGTKPSYIKANSPASLISSEPAAHSLYFVLTAGVRDFYFLARMRAFARQLDELRIPHEFHVTPGAHDATAWRAGLDAGLSYLARTLEPWAATVTSRFQGSRL